MSQTSASVRAVGFSLSLCDQAENMFGHLEKSSLYYKCNLQILLVFSQESDFIYFFSYRILCNVAALQNLIEAEFFPPTKTFLLVKVHNLISRIYCLAFIHRSSGAPTIFIFGNCVFLLCLLCQQQFLFDLMGSWCRILKGRKVFLFCTVGSLLFSFQDWLAIQSTWQLCKYKENGTNSWI